MSRIVMWNMVTLDGFFEGPKSWDIDWHEIGWGPDLKRFAVEQSKTAEALLFGRVTYQGMADYWTKATGEIADFMNRVPKVVFSRTLESADWNNTRLVKGDAVAEVATIRANPGREVLIFGSANLSATLIAHDLIDEYRLGVNPVVLGAGSPLFKPAGRRRTMKLLGAEPLSTGCVILRYEPAQAP